MSPRKAARTVWICLAIGACSGAEPPPSPPPECASAWDLEASTELVDQLVQATSADHTVWTDYNVGDASYVLNAGPSDSGGACLGLWHAGRAISYTLAPDEPSLLTPLYGYYFDAAWHGGPDAEMLVAAAQPPAVRTWLESHDVPTAIVLPVTVTDFPIPLPPLVKVQLGMHEAFHIDVQAPRWYASTGNWPVWDRQPDRAGLAPCYTANDNVVAALEAERTHLASLVESLLDGDTAQACEACRAFQEQRRERYALLDDVRVARHDSTPATCEEPEAIMEMEEGIADYASWTVLYDLGMASRETLMRRYRAIQNDVYYLTGAMQLHAVCLLQPDSMADVMVRIAQSQGPGDGSVTAILNRALASFCPATVDGGS